MRRALLPLAVAAAVAASSTRARATAAVGGELALEGGFATRPDTSDNSIGPGGGVRGGVTVGGFYAGVRIFAYSYGNAGARDAFESATMVTLGADVGYGATLGDRWILRPQVGVGTAFLALADNGNTAADEHSALELGLYFEPGVALLCLLGDVFVGADVNATVFVPANDLRPALALHLQLGVRF